MGQGWKFVGIGLVIVASVAGLCIPLAPELVHVAPDRIAPGRVRVEVKGYNTTFQETQAVLVNGEQRICARSMEVIDAKHAVLEFDVPQGLREAMSDLEVGPLRYSGAFFTEGLGEGSVVQQCPEAPSMERGVVFPNRSILYESIRNLHFHVPMWFTMIALMGISVYYSIRGLGSNALDDDRAAVSAARVGLLFCLLGLVTGAFWARATWGAFWTNDVKLNGAAVTGLIYLAYLVLRASVQEPYKRARLAGIYNIFAFMLLLLFLFVLPRLNAIDSLHPGNGGNSGFSDLDLDDRLRMVFYPAVFGWILIGVWMFTLRHRLARLESPNDA